MAYLLVRVENFNRFDGEMLTADPAMVHGQQGGGCLMNSITFQ
jgi:hypothetical protein